MGGKSKKKKGAKRMTESEMADGGTFETDGADEATREKMKVAAGKSFAPAPIKTPAAHSNGKLGLAGAGDRLKALASQPMRIQPMKGARQMHVGVKDATECVVEQTDTDKDGVHRMQVTVIDKEGKAHTGWVRQNDRTHQYFRLVEPFAGAVDVGPGFLVGHGNRQCWDGATVTARRALVSRKEPYTKANHSFKLKAGEQGLCTGTAATGGVEWGRIIGPIGSKRKHTGWFELKPGDTEVEGGHRGMGEVNPSVAVPTGGGTSGGAVASTAVDEGVPPQGKKKTKQKGIAGGAAAASSVVDGVPPRGKKKTGQKKKSKKDKKIAQREQERAAQERLAQQEANDRAIAEEQARLEAAMQQAKEAQKVARCEQLVARGKGQMAQEQFTEAQETLRTAMTLQTSGSGFLELEHLLQEASNCQEAVELAAEADLFMQMERPRLAVVKLQEAVGCVSSLKARRGKKWSVSLIAGESKKLGIVMDRKARCPPRIGKITPNSLADETQLKAGWAITAVQGKHVEGFGYDECVAAIKKVDYQNGAGLHLTVMLPPGEEFEGDGERVSESDDEDEAEHILTASPILSARYTQALTRAQEAVAQFELQEKAEEEELERQHQEELRKQEEKELFDYMEKVRVDAKQNLEKAHNRKECRDIASTVQQALASDPDEKFQKRSDLQVIAQRAVKKARAFKIADAAAMLLDDGFHADAVEQYKEALALDPVNSIIQEGSDAAERALEEQVRSAVQAEEETKRIELKKKKLQLLVEKATAQMEQNEYYAAAATLESALAGKKYLSAADIELVETMAAKAEKQGEAKQHCLQGLDLIMRGKIKAGLAQYEKAIKLDPSNERWPAERDAAIADRQAAEEAQAAVAEEAKRARKEQKAEEKAAKHAAKRDKQIAKLAKNAQIQFDSKKYKACTATCSQALAVMGQAPPLLPESIDSLDGGKEEREGHTEPYHSCWKGWPMRCRSLCLGYCTTAETNHGLQHIQADDMRHDACFGPLGSTCQYYCTPMYEPVGEMRCLPGDSGYQGGLCSPKYEEGSGGSILPPRPVPDWIKQKYNASA